MRAKLLSGLACAVALTACVEAGPSLAEASGHHANAEYGDRARARLIDAAGNRIGEVHLWQGRDGVVVEVRARNLPPGMHGLHIHAVGDCSDVGVFTRSGGHLDVTGGAHGALHPHGPHGGDLPNLYAHADGVARADFFATRISLADVQDADGGALIVHANADDYQTAPIGGAGARIACAAFSPRP